MTKRLSVPHEKLELIIDIRDFITMTSLRVHDFQFRDLRKMKTFLTPWKHQMKMMKVWIYCLQSFFSFCHFAVFSTLAKEQVK